MRGRFPTNDSYRHEVASCEEISSELATNFRSRILCPDTFSHRNALELPSERIEKEVAVATDTINKKMAMATKIMSFNVSYDHYLSEAINSGDHPHHMIQPIDFPELTLRLLTREMLFKGRKRDGLDDNSFFRPLNSSDIKKFTSYIADLDHHDTRLAFTDIFKNQVRREVEIPSEHAPDPLR